MRRRGGGGWRSAGRASALPWITIMMAGVAVPSVPTSAGGQERPERERIERLSQAPITFDQPDPDRFDVRGVPVLLLEDRDLPLVTVLVGFEGGYGHFPREDYAAATAMPSLLRYGGTSDMDPAAVDAELETYAIQLSFGSGGGAISSTMNTLSEHLEVSMDIWGRMLTDPGFDTDEIDIWRGRQLESVRRRPDDPSTLAFSEFNRLLYGDHPIGWEMDEADLTPEALSRERLERLHRRIVCRDNMLVGVTGDVSWRELRSVMERLLERVPECEAPLPEPPLPDVRREAGVFVIDRKIEQAVVVLAHPTDLPLADDPAYFAATIGNAILGAGGFSSRILSRVRTERGFAYSASSLWTTPRTYPGLLGAVTRTRPETAVSAIEVILETMRELRSQPPTEEEVTTAVDRITNGFVFNFDSPAQIVSRTMFYLAQDLPADWLERYLRGVQAVDARGIGRVFADHLRPDDMTILVVGDAERIGWEALESLGPVSRLDVPEPGPPESGPRGGPVGGAGS